MELSFQIGNRGIKPVAVTGLIVKTAFFFSFEMAPWFENDSLLPLLICILRVRSFALCKSLDRNR